MSNEQSPVNRNGDSFEMGSTEGGKTTVIWTRDISAIDSVRKRHEKVAAKGHALDFPKQRQYEVEALGFRKRMKDIEFACKKMLEHVDPVLGYEGPERGAIIRSYDKWINGEPTDIMFLGYNVGELLTHLGAKAFTDVVNKRPWIDCTGVYGVLTRILRESQYFKGESNQFYVRAQISTSDVIGKDWFFGPGDLVTIGSIGKTGRGIALSMDHDLYVCVKPLAETFTPWDLNHFSRPIKVSAGEVNSGTIFRNRKGLFLNLPIERIGDDLRLQEASNGYIVNKGIGRHNIKQVNKFFSVMETEETTPTAGDIVRVEEDVISIASRFFDRVLTNAEDTKIFKAAVNLIGIDVKIKLGNRSSEFNPVEFIVNRKKYKLAPGDDQLISAKVVQAMPILNSPGKDLNYYIAIQVREPTTIQNFQNQFVTVGEERTTDATLFMPGHDNILIDANHIVSIRLEKQAPIREKPERNIRL